MVASTYDRKCRFLRGNDTQSTVEWFTAAKDAPSYDGWSAIVSLDYEPDKWFDYPLGEVSDARRRFVNKRALSGLNYDHVCGESIWFGEGEPYQPDLPPMEYGTLGLPLCCGVRPGMRGGAGAGGKAAFVITPLWRTLGGAGAGGVAQFAVEGYVDPAEGGGEGGGSAGDVLTFTDASAGGGEGGGSAGDVFVMIDASAGGGEGGGSAGDVFVFIDASAGGGEGGGSAGDVPVLADPTEGGGEGGGSAGDVFVMIDASAGGGEGGGSAGDVFVFIDASAGGGEGGGSAGDVLTFTDASEGGGEGGGSAGDVFTPAPTPGTTCATAAAVVTGITYNGTTAAGPGSKQWWVFATTVGVHTLTTTGLIGGPVNAVVYAGTSCAALGAPNAIFMTPQTVGTGATGLLYVEVTNGGGGANAYTLKLV